MQILIMKSILLPIFVCFGSFTVTLTHPTRRFPETSTFNKALDSRNIDGDYILSADTENPFPSIELASSGDYDR